MSELEKKAIWKRWWFIAVISMFLFVLISAFLLLKDVEAKEAPEHLRYEYPRIADEDNIYVDLLPAVEDLEKLQDKCRELKLGSDDLDPRLRDEYVQKIETEMPESIKTFREEIILKKTYLSNELVSIEDILAYLGPLRFYYMYECHFMHSNANKKAWREVHYGIS